MKGTNKIDADSILWVLQEVCRDKLFQRIVIGKLWKKGRYLMYFVADGRESVSYARGSCTPR